MRSFQAAQVGFQFARAAEGRIVAGAEQPGAAFERILREIMEVQPFFDVLVQCGMTARFQDFGRAKSRRRPRWPAPQQFITTQHLCFASDSLHGGIQRRQVLFHFDQPLRPAFPQRLGLILRETPPHLAETDGEQVQRLCGQ